VTIKTANFHNFTSLPAEVWQFSASLNVVISDNGLGKSHLLKALYSTIKALNAPTGVTAAYSEFSNMPKSVLGKEIAEQLFRNLRPDSLGRLVKRKPGRSSTDVSISFVNSKNNIKFGFATNAISHVQVIEQPLEGLQKPPVFIPTRELITLCPWFLSLYDNFNVEFEQSWRDTVSLCWEPQA
jgi:AAA15 family ATPase/GTPase